METEVGKREDELPQLLDLISNEKDWFKGDAGGGGNSLGTSEEEELELTLAPPGGEAREKLEKLSNSLYKNTVVGTQLVFYDSAKPNAEGFQQENFVSSLEASRRMDRSHERGVHSAPEDGVLVKNRSQIRQC